MARHKRFGDYMSMETMTTSPVESMNRMMKTNVHSNLNLSKSVSVTTQTFDQRFDNHRKNSLRDTNKINRASQSVTKRLTERKAQYLFDISFDARKHVKAVHLSPELWLVWDFREVNKATDVAEKWKWLWDKLPSYHNVFKMCVKRRGEKKFLWCQCRHFDE